VLGKELADTGAEVGLCALLDLGTLTVLVRLVVGNNIVAQCTAPVHLRRQLPCGSE
jgi:hypothetical protein